MLNVIGRVEYGESENIRARLSCNFFYAVLCAFSCMIDFCVPYGMNEKYIQQNIVFF